MHTHLSELTPLTTYANRRSHGSCTGQHVQASVADASRAAVINAAALTGFASAQYIVADADAVVATANRHACSQNPMCRLRETLEAGRLACSAPGRVASTIAAWRPHRWKESGRRNIGRSSGSAATIVQVERKVNRGGSGCLIVTLETLPTESRTGRSFGEEWKPNKKRIWASLTCVR